MRISDWSSDVCSSDLEPVRSCLLPVESVGGRAITTIEGIGATPAGARVQRAWLDIEVVQCGYCQSGQIMSASALLARNAAPDDDNIDAAMARSEEHTSELQSLMRISYAVFCLKKKKPTNRQQPQYKEH